MARAETVTDEQQELKWLRWYYKHIQAYVEHYKPKDIFKDETTIEEWFINYYEMSEWGPKNGLKVPNKYKEKFSLLRRYEQEKQQRKLDYG